MFLTAIYVSRLVSMVRLYSARGDSAVSATRKMLAGKITKYQNTIGVCKLMGRVRDLIFFLRAAEFIIFPLIPVIQVFIFLFKKKSPRDCAFKTFVTW